METSNIPLRSYNIRDHIRNINLQNIPRFSISKFNKKENKKENKKKIISEEETVIKSRKGGKDIKVLKKNILKKNKNNEDESLNNSSDSSDSSDESSESDEENYSSEKEIRINYSETNNESLLENDPSTFINKKKINKSKKKYENENSDSGNSEEEDLNEKKNENTDDDAYDDDDEDDEDEDYDYEEKEDEEDEDEDKIFNEILNNEKEKRMSMYETEIKRKNYKNIINKKDSIDILNLIKKYKKTQLEYKKEFSMFQAQSFLDKEIIKGILSQNIIDLKKKFYDNSIKREKEYINRLKFLRKNHNNYNKDIFLLLNELNNGNNVKDDMIFFKKFINNKNKRNKDNKNNRNKDNKNKISTSIRSSPHKSNISPKRSSLSPRKLNTSPKRSSRSPDKPNTSPKKLSSRSPSIHSPRKSTRSTRSTSPEKIEEVEKQITTTTSTTNTTTNTTINTTTINDVNHQFKKPPIILDNREVRLRITKIDDIDDIPIKKRKISSLDNCKYEKLLMIIYILIINIIFFY